MNYASCSAEHLLIDLGITAPEQIDIEAIAWAAGARVRYRALSQCDAILVGVGERALIAVDQNASIQRQRFSVAHELGHWHRHRGRQLTCSLAKSATSEDSLAEDMRSCRLVEREADEYAADLLMPGFLIDAVFPMKGMLASTTIREAARLFNVSFMAAALRLVERWRDPVVLIVCLEGARSWFRVSPTARQAWHLRTDIAAIATRGAQHFRFVPARRWLLRYPDTIRYLREESILISATSKLVTIVQ